MSENIAIAFNKNHCNILEYFQNFTLGILDGSEETWGNCFDTMPAEIDIHAYLQYLKDEIEDCNFEPYPRDHTFEHYSPKQIAMVREELKPKYMAIVAFAKKRSTKQQ